MTLWLMYAKKPTKIYGKNLWQKPLKICDKNPLKIRDKNPYITKTFLTFNFQTQQKPLFMITKFHLLLDRSQFETTDITQLEELLLKYATSEGETNWQKSSVVSITDTPEDTKYELWIEDNKLNGEDVTFIHWYSKLWYIIQTN